MSCCNDLWYCTADGPESVSAVDGVFTPPAGAISGPYRTEALALESCQPPPYVSSTCCTPTHVFEWPRAVTVNLNSRTGVFGSAPASAVIATPPPPVGSSYTTLRSVVWQYDTETRLTAYVRHACFAPSVQLTFAVQFGWESLVGGIWTTAGGAFPTSGVTAPWQAATPNGDIQEIGCGNQPDWTGTFATMSWNGVGVGPTFTAPTTPGTFTAEFV